MKRTVVRYEVAPEHADENVRLVKDVYAELAELNPRGFRYRTLQLGDGVSFVHVADAEDGAVAPLTGLESFRRFQAGLGVRCLAPPVVSEAREVGSFGHP